MSRLLDSIKQADRARRKKNKTAPVEATRENHQDAAENTVDSEPGPTADAQVDESTPPGTVIVRIEAEKANQDALDKEPTAGVSSSGDNTGHDEATTERSKSRARSARGRRSAGEARRWHPR